MIIISHIKGEEQAANIFLEPAGNEGLNVLTG